MFVQNSFKFISEQTVFKIPVVASGVDFKNLKCCLGLFFRQVKVKFKQILLRHEQSISVEHKANAFTILTFLEVVFMIKKCFYCNLNFQIAYQPA
jgi:hypothetical protein